MLSTKQMCLIYILSSIFSRNTSFATFSRDDTASQTVYQYQKKPRKCANLRSQGSFQHSNAILFRFNSEYNTFVPGIANGSNALSYMSFVAAIITLGKLISSKNNNIRQDHIKKKHSAKTLITNFN